MALNPKYAKTFFFEKMDIRVFYSDMTICVYVYKCGCGGDGGGVHTHTHR